MATATKSQRLSRFTTKITKADEKLLSRAATLEGVSVEDYVLAKVRAAAKETVRSNRQIPLTTSQSRRFVQALLAPPRQPSRRTRSALALHRETVIER